MSNQTEQLFVEASRKKIRFESKRGFLLVEDLWDLKLEDLDAIAVNLNDKIEKLGKKSFIGKRTSATDTELSFEIVKYIIGVKIEEADARKTKAEKAAKKQHLLGLLEEKQNEELKSKSIDELKKLIAEQD